MSDLVVENLTVRYGGIKAVRGISFSVRPGELLALVGPNGAGKSSIARAIMGLVPAEGNVTIGGRPVLGEPTHRHAGIGVSFVPEGRGIFAPLSVRENILIGGYKLDRKNRDARLRDVCDLFPALGRRLDQEASSLSGGEQQMLAVARALMTSPRVLICDEPSMGLAPAITKTLFDTLRKIADRGAAVLVGDQNANRLFGVADRISVLRLGVMAISGSPSDFGSVEALAAHYFGKGTAASSRQESEVRHG